MTRPSKRGGGRTFSFSFLTAFSFLTSFAPFSPLTFLALGCSSSSSSSSESCTAVRFFLGVPSSASDPSTAGFWSSSDALAISTCGARAKGRGQQ